MCFRRKDMYSSCRKHKTVVQNLKFKANCGLLCTIPNKFHSKVLFINVNVYILLILSSKSNFVYRGYQVNLHECT